jgi:isopentenyl-diphosphate delta-isomerase
MNRKDDHLKFALAQTPQANDFDKVRFVPEALPSVNPAAVDVSVTLFGRRFEHPIYINAMTGGSKNGEAINRKLAMLAAACNLPMATGSLSAALKDPQWIPGFEAIRELHPAGFLLANVSLNLSVKNAKEAMAMIRADALQIHLNAAQEITMPEGDVDFETWETRLRALIEGIDVPVIVKETGNGMSRSTMERLLNMGVDAIDVSGSGGTNFIRIENQRRKHPMESFESHGFSTVESLLEAKGLPVPKFASGGIRGAYDIVKALALGADLVGMSSYFLHLVEEYPFEEAVEAVKQLLADVRAILAILNCRNLSDLRKAPLFFDSSLLSFQAQRNPFREKS